MNTTALCRLHACHQRNRTKLRGQNQNRSRQAISVSQTECTALRQYASPCRPLRSPSPRRFISCGQGNSVQKYWLLLEFGPRRYRSAAPLVLPPWTSTMLGNRPRTLSRLACNLLAKVSASASPGWRLLPPANTTGVFVGNAVQYASVINAGNATRLVRQQRRDDRPFPIR